MTEISRKLFAVSLACAVCAFPLPVLGEAENDESVRLETICCQSLPAEGQQVFPAFQEFDGIRCRLIRTEINASEAPADGENKEAMEVRTSGLLMPGEEWTPENVLWEGGEAYRLMEVKTERSNISGRTQHAEGRISYRERTEKPPVPQNAEFEIEDRETGEVQTVTLPFVGMEENWRWQDDFQAVLTAEPAGAREYLLGDTVVELGEETPGLAGYETEILQALGLDAGHYRIEEMEWAGPVYVKDGIKRRDIRLSGSRYVADYEACYAGEAPLSDVSGRVLVALYQREGKEAVARGCTVTAFYQPEPEGEELFSAAAGASAGILVTVLFSRRGKRKEKKAAFDNRK